MKHRLPQEMTLTQFEDFCSRFDWQWFWRDSATVADQDELMNRAESLGDEFVALYEQYRLKAQNPYCPLATDKRREQIKNDPAAATAGSTNRKVYKGFSMYKHKYIMPISLKKKQIITNFVPTQNSEEVSL